MRNKERWIKSLLSGVVISGVRVILASFFQNEEFQEALGPSILFQTDLYLPVLFLVGWPIYTLLTYSYFLVDFRMPGPKGIKVTQFVMCELLIWLLYSSEPLPHIVGSVLIVALLKTIILFMVQGKLLKLFLARERLMYRPNPFFYPRGLAVFSLVFALFRLISYAGLDIYSLDDTQLIFSLTWSAAMGFGIGLSFSVLQRFLLRQDRQGKTIQFALIFFALNSIAYHTFNVLRYDVGLSDIIIRSGMDILAVWLATYIVVQWQIEEGSAVSASGS